MSDGKRNTRGTPRGGVASPLLANNYMNRFLKHWRLTESGEASRKACLMSGDGKRGDGQRLKPPRPSSTLPQQTNILL
jgi:hypothetical protein